MLIQTRHLFILLLVSVFPMAFAAKEAPLPPPPPMAQAATIAAYRGKSVDIYLRALGRAPSQLRFLIRSQPKHGTLSEIRLVDRKTAVVTYSHNDKAGDVVDSFSFAAQANDSAVSASAQILISVSEEPSELLVLPALSFGRVFIGDNNRQELTLTNAGGGVLEGIISVPPPWKLEGSAEYRLARREEKNLTITFSPNGDRDFVGELIFSSGMRKPVILSGRGVSPLEVEPAQLEFISSSRKASFDVRNVSDREHTIIIAKPPQISGPDQMTLAAGASASVPLSSAPTFHGAMESVITLKAGSYNHVIPFRLYAIPPILRANPAGALDFGFVRPGRRYTKSFSITNEGGVSASLTANLPPGLILIPTPSSVILAPGETRSFEAAIEPGNADDAQATIVLQARGGVPVSIPVAMMKLPSNIIPPVDRSKNTSSAKASPTPSSGTTTPSTQPSAQLSNSPAIDAIQIATSKDNEITISWNKPENARNFIIELREIAVDNPGSIIKWVEWKDITFTERDGVVTARFPSIPAGQSRYIRITTVDMAGLKSAPSDTIRISTRPSKPFFIPWWILAPLLALAGFGLWKVWRGLRMTQDEVEAARIARLEKR